MCFGSPILSDIVQKEDGINGLTESKLCDGGISLISAFETVVPLLIKSSDDSSLLKQSLAAEEGSLAHHKHFLKEHERKAEVLRHLILRFERSFMAMDPDLVQNVYPGLGSDKSEIAGRLIESEKLSHISGELQGTSLVVAALPNTKSGTSRRYQCVERVARNRGEGSQYLFTRH